MLGMGYVILLWHSMSLPYNYFVKLTSLTAFSDVSFHYFADMLQAISCPIPPLGYFTGS